MTLVSLRLPAPLAVRIDREVSARRARATSWAERSCTRADVLRDGVEMLLAQAEAERAPASKAKPRKKAGR
jgi:hypothetical protein